MKCRNALSGSLPALLLVAASFATSVAARTETVPCGATLTESITLEHDLDCMGPAIQIDGTPPITLDLGGHTVASSCIDPDDFSCATIVTSSATIQNGRVVQRGPAGFAIYPGPLLLQNLVVDGGAVVNLLGGAVFGSTFVNGANLICDDSNLQVEDSDFVDGPPDGVAVSGGFLCGATIRNNAFSGYGLAVYLRSPWWASTLRIENNWIEDGGILIEGGSSGTPILGGFISGNHVDSALGDGISASGGHGGVGLVLEITANEVVGSGGQGIRVEADQANGDRIEISSNLAVANAGLGIEALGTGSVDGGGNLASANGDPLQCSGVQCAPAWAMDVTPRSYDFGDVEVGASASQVVTIFNPGGFRLVVDAIEMLPGSAPAFALGELPPLPTEIAAQGTLDVSIAFAPSSGDPATATLRIRSNDETEPVVDVTLAGRGVPQDVQAMALLDFFDAAVAAGDLHGTGPAPAAARRLAALRHNLEASGDLLDRGRGRAACAQLELARRRIDGSAPPPDFAAGPGAADLEREIADLRANLGCGSRPSVCGLGAELALLLPALRMARARRRRP